MAKGIAHREWVIHRADYIDDFGNDTGFREAVEAEAVANVHLMERLGVAVVSAPVRRQGPSGGWFTEAVVFKTATVPGVRDAQAEEPEVDEEAEDLVGAVGLTDD